MWIAGEVGFRPYVADWRGIKVHRDGVSASRGQEVLSQNERLTIREQERIAPDVIIHRKMIRARSRALFTEFGSAFLEALISYHPSMQQFCGKWTAELCFRARQRVEFVPRPATYLYRSDQIHEGLREVGDRQKLIFKPSIGTRCFGIQLSSPATFSDVSKSVRGSRWGSYVVQQLIEDPVLVEGRKFDLRIYALITSFAPLAFRVYREGVTRIAVREFDPDSSDAPLVSLTGDSFRKRMGEKPVNVTVTALLRSLSEGGYKTGDFWRRLRRRWVPPSGPSPITA